MAEWLTGPQTHSSQVTTDNIVLCEHGSALSIGCTSGLIDLGRRRQTPLSHSSTESEVIPLDAGKIDCIALLTCEMWC